VRKLNYPSIDLKKLFDKKIFGIILIHADLNDSKQIVKCTRAKKLQRIKKTSRVIMLIRHRLFCFINYEYFVMSERNKI